MDKFNHVDHNVSQNIMLDTGLCKILLDIKSSHKASAIMELRLEAHTFDEQILDPRLKVVPIAD